MLRASAQKLISFDGFSPSIRSVYFIMSDSNGASLGELVPCGGGDPIPLQQHRLLIGRRSRCDISLRFPNVSSHHCELQMTNGYWHVRDLNSRNGIKVNDERCDSKYLIPGDVLSIAKHRFEIMYTPDADAPPPDEEEDIMSLSLMEKAGLERRRPESPSPPPPAAHEPDPEQRFSDDEEAASEWLSE